MTTTGRAPTAAEVGAATSADADLDAIVAAVAAGDPAAFARVYDALAPVAHGIAARVLRDPDGATDVTREVMLEVWRDAPRYVRERGSVQAWVATTAHRRAVDRVRAGPGRPARETGRPGSPSLEATADGARESVVDRTEAERVRACLATLPETQRRAVLLAYFGARTHREVAQELDVGPGTTTGGLRDGLQRLRACLGVTG